MAVEARRACGFRKVGGLYLVSAMLSAPCGRLPMPLHVCPTCGQGVKQSRNHTWIDGRDLFAAHVADTTCTASYCDACPVGNLSLLNDRDVLLWIGEKYYPTPRDFAAEAAEMGISRRLSSIPKGFEIGKTWCFFAHPKACEVTVQGSGRIFDHVAGVISACRPDKIEKIVTATQAQDTEAMDALRAQGITPVAVPDDDDDHNPEGL